MFEKEEGQVKSCCFSISARSSVPVIDPTAPSPVAPLSVAAAETMQLGWSRFSHSERHRWLTAKVCLYCRQPGHFIAQVGQKTKLPSRYRTTGEQSFFLFHTRPFDNTWFSPLVWWLTCLCPFFNSGADDSFVDQDLVTHGTIPAEDLSEPKTIHDLNREILAK